jgi:hypothetical protein
MKLMNTRNVTENDNDDELQPEYDLSKLKGAVRGKYFRRATAGTTLVLLEPDVAEAFPDAKTVNQALRTLAKIAQTQKKTGRTAVKRPATVLRPSASRAKASVGPKGSPRSRRLKP